MTDSSTYIRQAAAIPVRAGRVCLVTSRSGGRWVVPKGHLEPGKTVAEIALQEAWEEAGLTGAIQPEPVGSYLYTKYGNTYHVVVFVMEVTEAAAVWPECTLRKRAWIEPADAIVQVAEKGLGVLIQAATAERALSVL